MEKGKMIFITGGVRSGKSSFAEKLAAEYAEISKANLHYIACGIPFDQEMQERVHRHQQDREQAAVTWKTWEQAVYLTKIAASFSKQDVLLLDCVTTLINNYLYQENMTDQTRLIAQIKQDITELMDQVETLLVVSNEVLQDVTYKDTLTRDYQYILGQIHQWIVKEASSAILVESGMPLYKKG